MSANRSSITFFKPICIGFYFGDNFVGDLVGDERSEGIDLTACTTSSYWLFACVYGFRVLDEVYTLFFKSTRLVGDIGSWPKEIIDFWREGVLGSCLSMTI